MAKRAPCTTGPWTRGPRRKWSSTPWTWGINFFDTANGYSAGTSEEYLGRALKKNVRVAISARAAGEQAELAFTDNGPGVPPEQLPRLFDPFYRGDAAHPKLLQTVWGVGYRLGRTAR